MSSNSAEWGNCRSEKRRRTCGLARTWLNFCALPAGSAHRFFVSVFLGGAAVRNLRSKAFVPLRGICCAPRSGAGRRSGAGVVGGSSMVRSRPPASPAGDISGTAQKSARNVYVSRMSPPPPPTSDGQARRRGTRPSKRSRFLRSSAALGNTSGAAPAPCARGPRGRTKGRASLCEAAGQAEPPKRKQNGRNHVRVRGGERTKRGPNIGRRRCPRRRAGRKRGRRRSLRGEMRRTNGVAGDAFAESELEKCVAGYALRGGTQKNR